MEFFKGLISVAYILSIFSLIGWIGHEVGFRKGIESEQFAKFTANQKLQRCNRIISMNGER